MNALGNLSSVVNPWVIGMIRDSTGSFNGGLLWLVGMAVMSIGGVSLILSLWGSNANPVPGILKEAP